MAEHNRSASTDRAGEGWQRIGDTFRPRPFAWRADSRNVISRTSERAPPSLSRHEPFGRSGSGCDPSGDVARRRSPAKTRESSAGAGGTEALAKRKGRSRVAREAPRRERRGARSEDDRDEDRGEGRGEAAHDEGMTSRTSKKVVWDLGDADGVHVGNLDHASNYARARAPVTRGPGCGAAHRRGRSRSRR